MVIQRWQSVYLLIASILMATYAFLPIAEFTTSTGVIEMGLSGTTVLEQSTKQPVAEVVNGMCLWGLFAVSILVALFALITIFRYKNLKLQKKLCLIGGSLSAVLLISVMIMIMAIDCASYSISIANIIPVMSIVMFYLADCGISKDQKLLSGYDRIR